jgi:hypothetical protein
LCWLFLLEEYGLTFEYLPGNKNEAAVVDALSHHEIDSLKIQDKKEQVLTLPSGSDNSSTSNIKFPINTSLIFKEQAEGKGFSRSENNGISNIKFTIPMHTSLIFKEQAKVKDAK